MNQYLSWAEIMSTAVDVALTILAACLLASLLIYAFALFGRQYSLDPRVFPTVTGRQRQWFGFLGFYLLTLIALEILNPPSLEFVASGNINYQPGFLGKQVGGLSVQSWISIVAFAGLLVYFVQRIRHLNRTNARLERYSASGDGRADLGQFEEKSQRLKVAFGYCALSFLIAIIAPGLDNFGISSLGPIVILGLVLIAGVACYLEAMQLGAQFAGISRGDLAIQLVRHVFLSRFAIYLGIGLAGYLFYSGLPRHYADDPNVSALPDLVRTLSTIVAGVVLLLAAFLITWGLDGFSPRIQRFMVLAAISLALLPLCKLITTIIGNSESISTDPDSTFAIVYALVLLIVPVLFYLFANSENPNALQGEQSTLAYVRSLGWAPLSIGQSLAGLASQHRWKLLPFATSEEMLDDLIGRHARTETQDWLDWLTPLRERIDLLFGWNQRYDGLVLDARSALRLLDAIELQALGRAQPDRYQIVAGICRHSDGLVFRQAAGSADGLIGVWADAPYLPRNHTLESLVKIAIGAGSPAEEIEAVDYLPPNVIGEKLPPATVAAVPEPFATDLLVKAEKRGDTDKLILAPEAPDSWLFENFDLLLARSDASPIAVTEMITNFSKGRDWLRMKTGPSGLGNSFARQVAADLEGVSVQELEENGSHYLSPVAVSVCLAMTNFHRDSVIDPEDVRKGSAWSAIESLYLHLSETGLVRHLSLQQLKQSIDCHQIAEMTPPEITAAAYPVNISRYLVSDSPGKVSAILESLHASDISLSFLLAQRIYGEGDMGIVYMLPTDPADDEHIAGKAKQHEWVASGHSGFLAIAIDHTPGELVNLLGKIHYCQVLSVETLTVFPTSADRAIVLISFGNIPQDQMDLLLATLAESGYEVLSDPATWSAPAR